MYWFYDETNDLFYPAENHFDGVYVEFLPMHSAPTFATWVIAPLLATLFALGYS
jgi:hypothetical protein